MTRITISRYEKHFAPNVALQHMVEALGRPTRSPEKPADNHSKVDSPSSSGKYRPHNCNHCPTFWYTILPCQTTNNSRLDTGEHLLALTSISLRFLCTGIGTKKEARSTYVYALDSIAHMESLFLKALEISTASSAERHEWLQKYMAYSDSIRKQVVASAI